MCVLLIRLPFLERDRPCCALWCRFLRTQDVWWRSGNHPLLNGSEIAGGQLREYVCRRKSIEAIQVLSICARS